MDGFEPQLAACGAFSIATATAQAGGGLLGRVFALAVCAALALRVPAAAAPGC